jgi:hypothetical protein
MGCLAYYSKGEEKYKFMDLFPYLFYPFRLLLPARLAVAFGKQYDSGNDPLFHQPPNSTSISRSFCTIPRWGEFARP